MTRRPRIIAGLISLLIYSIICLLSSLPASSLPSGIPDFIPHSIEYFALAFYFIQIFASPRRRRTMIAAWLMVGVLAFLDERHQLSSPGRFFSWLDILFDMLGALAGFAIYAISSRRADKKGEIGCLWRLLLLQHRAESVKNGVSD